MSQSMCYFCNKFYRNKPIMFKDVPEFMLVTLILNTDKKTTFYLFEGTKMNIKCAWERELNTECSAKTDHLTGTFAT